MPGHEDFHVNDTPMEKNPPDGSAGEDDQNSGITPVSRPVPHGLQDALSVFHAAQGGLSEAHN
ncbi:MAG: hypothetical protein AMXMBFR83_29590 [Phycisphaerae bacterium]